MSKQTISCRPGSFKPIHIPSSREPSTKHGKEISTGRHKRRLETEQCDSGKCDGCVRSYKRNGKGQKPKEDEKNSLANASDSERGASVAQEDAKDEGAGEVQNDGDDAFIYARGVSWYVHEEEGEDQGEGKEGGEEEPEQNERKRRCCWGCLTCCFRRRRHDDYDSDKMDEAELISYELKRNRLKQESMSVGTSIVRELVGTEYQRQSTAVLKSGIGNTFVLPREGFAPFIPERSEEDRKRKFGGAGKGRFKQRHQFSDDEESPGLSSRMRNRNTKLDEKRKVTYGGADPATSCMLPSCRNRIRVTPLPSSCQRRSCKYSSRLSCPVTELPYSATHRHADCIPKQPPHKPATGHRYRK